MRDVGDVGARTIHVTDNLPSMGAQVPSMLGPPH